MPKGELQYYLMASDFGFNYSDQVLFGPDISLKMYCNQDETECEKNQKFELGETLTITCGTENFGNFYFFSRFYFFSTK